MSEDIQELFDTVEELNGTIYDQHTVNNQHPDWIPQLEIESNGTCAIVTFCGNIIWSSEDDDRNFEDEGGYESFHDFLTRKMKLTKSIICKYELPS